MSDSAPPSGGEGQNPLSLRLLAILLMITGVVAFVIARVAFGDQMLCLLGSTLITFAGLGLIIAGRRYGWLLPRNSQAQPSPRQTPIDENLPRQSSLRPSIPRGAPRGLRAAARSTAMGNAPVRRSAPPLAPAPVQNVVPRAKKNLVDRVIEMLRSQNMYVSIETQHDDRAILRITGQNGELYTIMVREDPGEVDVSEVRALFALVTSSSSQTGYLISAGKFTQRAYDWAGSRQIRLVAADELDELMF
jgi:hypothetical protein